MKPIIVLFVLMLSGCCLQQGDAHKYSKIKYGKMVTINERFYGHGDCVIVDGTSLWSELDCKFQTDLGVLNKKIKFYNDDLLTNGDFQ